MLSSEFLLMFLAYTSLLYSHYPHLYFLGNQQIKIPFMLYSSLPLMSVGYFLGTSHMQLILLFHIIRLSHFSLALILNLWRAGTHCAQIYEIPHSCLLWVWGSTYISLPSQMFRLNSVRETLFTSLEIFLRFRQLGSVYKIVMCSIREAH